MSKRRGIKLSEDKTDINISPMIDMVFILLIFFIVTTVFVDERGFDAEKPRPNPNPPQEQTEGPVKFTIRENGDLYFNSEKISLTTVRQKVAERIREDPDSSVVIECHPSIKSSLMIMVMDEARLGKAKNISVDTTE